MWERLGENKVSEHDRNVRFHVWRALEKVKWMIQRPGWSLRGPGPGAPAGRSVFSACQRYRMLLHIFDICICKRAHMWRIHSFAAGYVQAESCCWIVWNMEHAFLFSIHVFYLFVHGAIQCFILLSMRIDLVSDLWTLAGDAGVQIVNGIWGHQRICN